MKSIIKKIKNRKINKKLEAVNKQLTRQENYIKNLYELAVPQPDIKSGLSVWVNPNTIGEAEKELHQLQEEKERLELQLKQ